MSEQEIIPAKPLTGLGNGYDRDTILPMIYAEVASGRALDRVLSDDDGMPSAATFWRWHMEDENIRDSLACARENGVEVHMGEVITIADDLTDDPASRRVRVDARLKLAAMIKPRKYGPKLDLTSSDRSMSPAGLSALYGDDEDSDKNQGE